MGKIANFLAFFTFLGVGAFFYHSLVYAGSKGPDSLFKSEYWLFLSRKSNVEYLYFGSPGDERNSVLIKYFAVKTGAPHKHPTPLPKLLGKEYWEITKKEVAMENEETGPYFLSLNIPFSENEPFGPVPYSECEGFVHFNEQCNWETPGEFGLHGVNSDESRLSAENEGSSGCIRHKDSDIAFLYYFLDPQKEQIRYYIEDI